MENDDLLTCWLSAAGKNKDGRGIKKIPKLCGLHLWMSPKGERKRARAAKKKKPFRSVGVGGAVFGSRGTEHDVYV